MRGMFYPTPDEIRAKLGDFHTVRSEAVTLFDSLGEYAEWHLGRGEGTGAGSVRAFAQNTLTGGNGEYVAASERFLEAFENGNIETVGFHWRDDVAGARANIPAFLSGAPLGMKNRKKVRRASSPIAVVFDAFPSVGIGANKMAEIGAAIFAFVRVLATHRPVELWVGGSYDFRGGHGEGLGGAWVLARVDTAPFNLAQGAYVVCAEGFGRYMSHVGLTGLYPGRTACGTGWPYGSMPATRAWMAKALKPAFMHVDEVYAIPAIGYGLGLLEDPKGWMVEEIRKHTATDLNEEEGEMEW